MKILFLGDIFGRPGREIVNEELPKIKKEHSIDFSIANIENAAHGKGITLKIINEMLAAGVDFFTSGNHVWRNKGTAEILDGDFPIIRPANYPPGVAGKGYKIFTTSLGVKVLIINLMGRVFIKENLDCPFREAQKILETIPEKDYDLSIVDFHAEATSEKYALKNFLLAKVSALVGTHTHVPTADLSIEEGTAYLSDVGMCGPAKGIIGLEKETVIKQFLDQLPIRHEVAEGEKQLNAVVISIDEKNRKAQNLEQIII